MVDSTGNFIIKSRGTATETNIYNYLAKQENEKEVQDTLRQVIHDKKSGTLAIINEKQKSLLGFLPIDAPEGCYLITVIPRAVLQQELRRLLL